MVNENLIKDDSIKFELNERGDTVLIFKSGAQLTLAGLNDAAIKDLERAKKENAITTDEEFMAEARKYLPV